MVKTATTSNNTYSSNEAYIIDRTHIWHATVKLRYVKKVQYSNARNA